MSDSWRSRGAKARRRSRILLLLLALSGSAEARSASGQKPKSPVFEGTKPASLVMMLKDGDELVSWERAASPPANPTPASGVLASPFEVVEVEREQAARGKVSLRVNRSGQALNIPMPPGMWQIKVRPNLQGDSLLFYREARETSLKGNLTRGRSLFVQCAAAERKAGNEESAAWLLSRAAGVAYLGGDRKASSEIFQQAIAGAQRIGKWKVESQLWAMFGDLQSDAGDLPGAKESYSHGLAIRTQHETESLNMAALQINLASTEEKQGHAREAVDLYSHALTIAEKEAPGSLMEAYPLLSLGAAQSALGNRDSGEAMVKRSVEIGEALAPNSIVTEEALRLLGAMAAERGDLAAAESLSLRALAINEQNTFSGPGNPSALQLAAIQQELGDVCASRGDLAQAEALFSRSLAIFREKAPGTYYEGIATMNLGELAARRGDTQSADTYLHAALEIFRKVEADPETLGSMADVLANLAGEAEDRADYVAAERYLRQSLKLREDREPGSVRNATAAAALGDVLSEQGKLDEALPLFQKALAMVDKKAPGSLENAAIEQGFGEAQIKGGKSSEAETHLRVAEAIRGRLAPDSADYATTLHSLGDLYRGRKNLPEAGRFYTEAIDALDRQSTRLGRSQEARSAFSGKYRQFYADSVAVLVETGQPNLAYSTLERSRARSLLELLAERDLVLENDVPADLDREQRRLGSQYERAQSQIQGLSPQMDKEQLDALLLQLNDLRRAKQDVADKIKSGSPRYASLQHPSPLGVAQTRSLLDAGTLLLCYSTGRDKTFLFAVEPAIATGVGLTVFTLASNEKGLRDAVEAYRNLVDLRGPLNAEALRNLQSRSAELYATLLKPADRLIAKFERILILPDGPLHTLPFAALVKDVKGGKPTYLVEWKPIHTAVSATVYAELTKRRRQSTAAAPIQIAGFGDPLYPKLQANKVAVKRGEGGEATEAETAAFDREVSGTEDPTLNSVLRAGFRLEPLPASRQEVEEITRLYAPRSAAYLGPDATEERAKAIGKDVPLIHFACHAILNPRFPLDSSLVLTIPEKPKEDQDNGLLQAWEIFEKMRIDADLVTLSACESGLGKEMGGEGLIGLTRAFQYAGAHSILASLWKVEDQATEELMKRFYTHLREGRTKDEALRTAQIDLIRTQDHSQPSDWGAFELIGDWR